MLSRRSAETLLDLVENKLSCLVVHDREDAREQAVLEAARRELMGTMGPVNRMAQIPAPAVAH